MNVNNENIAISLRTAYFLLIVSREIKTARIRVFQQDSYCGSYYFQDGLIIAATYQDKCGPVAALALLRLDNIKIDCLPYEVIDIPEPLIVEKCSLLIAHSLAANVKAEKQRQDLIDGGNWPQDGERITVAPGAEQDLNFELIEEQSTVVKNPITVAIDYSQLQLLNFISATETINALCPYCRKTVPLSQDDFRVSRRLSLDCLCGNSYLVGINTRRWFRAKKKISAFYGVMGPESQAPEVATKQSCTIRDLASHSVGLKVARNHNLKIGTRMKLKFNLDDAAQTLIVHGDNLTTDFLSLPGLIHVLLGFCFRQCW